MRRVAERIAASWDLVAGTFGALARRGALGYPLASLVVALVVLAVGLQLPRDPAWAGAFATATLYRLAVLLLVWALLELCSAFCAVALLNALQGAAGGQRPSTGKCLRVALGQWRPMAGFALVRLPFSALVFFSRPFGSLLRPLLNRLTARWFGLSLDALVLMALPPIALEGLDYRAGARRGARLLHDCWGAHPAATRSAQVFVLLLWLPALLLVGPPLLHRGFSPLEATLGDAGLVVAGLGLVLAQQLDALVGSVYALAAYRYARDGANDIYADPRIAPEAFGAPR